MSECQNVRINNKPHIANLLLDQNWKEGVFSSYTVPATAFADIDGDVLTYKATIPKYIKLASV